MTLDEAHPPLLTEEEFAFEYSGCKPTGQPWTSWEPAGITVLRANTYPLLYTPHMIIDRWDRLPSSRLIDRIPIGTVLYGTGYCLREHKSVRIGILGSSSLYGRQATAPLG